MPPLSSDPLVIRRALEFRQALLDRESRQAWRMALSWAKIEEHLNEQVETLAREMAERRAQGQLINVSRLLDDERYRLLILQTYKELENYSQDLGLLVEMEQEDRIRRGIQDAKSMINSIYEENGRSDLVGAFNVLPVEALETLVGTTADGSPLNRYFSNKYSPEVAQTISDTLLTNIAKGNNPRDTAREIFSKAKNLTISRSMGIARTEQLRVYRIATLGQYRYSRVVYGYRRRSGRGSRVCPACLFADGKFYELNDIMPEHPHGRCVMIPCVKNMPEPSWESGQTWFNHQDEGFQEKFLGPGRYNVWKDYKAFFSANDLYSVSDDQFFGPSMKTLGIKEFREAMEKKKKSGRRA